MIDGHQVALAILPALGPYGEMKFRAQCECGHFANFETPITLARINEVMSWPHQGTEAV